MDNHLPSFQRYQLAFTAYLRDPQNHPRPDGAKKERMAVYQEIVFNNLFESVSACFPVAQQVIGKRRWATLVRAFLREHSANSPLFRKIPEEFLNFLEHMDTDKHIALPPYFKQLCHYEWIELLVATLPDSETGNIQTNPSIQINPAGDLIAQVPIFTSTIQLLNYTYPVHKISHRNKVVEKSGTHLLVYRDQTDQVKFTELNAATYRLIDILKENQNITGKQALTQLANELNHPDLEKMISFGRKILNQLKNQGVILGTG